MFGRPSPKPVKVEVFAKTDLGRTRDHNEDHFLVADLTRRDACDAACGVIAVCGRVALTSRESSRPCFGPLPCPLFPFWKADALVRSPLLIPTQTA